MGRSLERSSCERGGLCVIYTINLNALLKRNHIALHFRNLNGAKMSRVTIALIILFLSACAVTKTVTFVGDSNTMGNNESISHVKYASSRLPADYPEIEWRFHNLGRGATDSEYWKNNINDVAITDADIYIIMLGTNDASKSNNIPLEEFRNNMEFIIDQTLKSNPDAKIVLITNGPMDCNAAMDDGILDGRSNSLLNKYAQVSRDLSTKYNIPMIDLFNLLYSKYEPNYQSNNVFISSPRGVHYTTDSYNLLWRELRPIVIKQAELLYRPSITIDNYKKSTYRSEQLISGTCSSGATVLVESSTAIIDPVKYPSPGTWNAMIRNMTLGDHIVSVKAMENGLYSRVIEAQIHIRLPLYQWK